MLGQSTVTELTGLLLEAHGDPDSPAGQQVVEDLVDWELVTGAKRFHNRKGLRDLFSQKPNNMDPSWDATMVTQLHPFACCLTMTIIPCYLVAQTTYEFNHDTVEASPSSDVHQQEYHLPDSHHDGKHKLLKY